MNYNKEADDSNTNKPISGCPSVFNVAVEVSKGIRARDASGCEGCKGIDTIARSKGIDIIAWGRAVFECSWGRAVFSKGIIAFQGVVEACRKRKRRCWRRWRWRSQRVWSSEEGPCKERCCMAFDTRRAGVLMLSVAFGFFSCCMLHIYVRIHFCLACCTYNKICPHLCV